MRIFQHMDRKYLRISRRASLFLALLGTFAAAFLAVPVAAYGDGGMQLQSAAAASLNAAARPMSPMSSMRPASPVRQIGPMREEDPSSDIAGNDARLDALQVASGTLLPAFSPSHFEYLVYAEPGVTNANIHVIPKDPRAEISISGGDTLVDRQTTREIAVTASSGATQTYTVVIVKTSAADFYIDEQLYTATADFDTASGRLPAGLQPASIEVRGEAVPALVSSDGQFAAVRILNYEDAKDEKWVVYDPANEQFHEASLVNIEGEAFFELQSGQSRQSGQDLLYGEHDGQRGYFGHSEAGFWYFGGVDQGQKAQIEIAPQGSQGISGWLWALPTIVAIAFAWLYFKEKRKAKFNKITENPYLGRDLPDAEK